MRSPSSRYTLEDFPVGLQMPLGTISASEQEIIAFGRLYDPQSFHTDSEAAVHSSFGGLVASGWHTCGLCTRLICQAFLSDTHCLGSPGVRSIQWKQPVRPGQILKGRMEVLEQNFSRTKPDRGVTVQRWQLFQEDGSVAFEAEMVIMLGRRCVGSESRRDPASDAATSR